jgi:hypothetical protein
MAEKKPSNYDEVVDAKMQVKKDAAYDAADSTPANPKQKATTKFGSKTGIEAAAMEKAYTDDYKKFGSVQGPADDQRIQSGMQAAGRAAKNEVKRETRGKGMASGGKVSASKRADGCVQKGKTRGRML